MAVYIPWGPFGGSLRNQGAWKPTLNLPYSNSEPFKGSLNPLEGVILEALGNQGALELLGYGHFASRVGRAPGETARAALAEAAPAMGRV